MHLRRHDDSAWHLHKALRRAGERFDRKTFQHWAAGTKVPNSTQNFELITVSPISNIYAGAAINP